MKKDAFCRWLKFVPLVAIVAGAVFAAAQTTVLYDFGSQSGDPHNPQTPGAIAQGRDGNLYSTTSSGGGFANGTAFKITPQGAVTVLYSFDQAHGVPQSGLTLGSDGNFYGTTETGGTGGQGSVFQLTPAGVLTVLYNFTGGSDGRFPVAPPIQGSDGNFYGTTTGQLPLYGTVYKLTPSGTLTTLHTFDNTTGAFPEAALLQGTDGNLYGTTQSGGAIGFGTVFRVTPAGQFALLHSFNVTDGYQPASPLIQASDGVFYGATQNNLFKITASGALTSLHTFVGGQGDGGAAFDAPVQASDGNLYGVTSVGGTLGAGVIYKYTLKGDYSIVFNFDPNVSGGNPSVSLLQNTNGILYGDTYAGGPGSACGGFCFGTFYSLNLGLKAMVTLLPGSAKVGKSAQVFGQGLTGTTAVSFNGAPATFNVVSDTFLTTTVPNGATTGQVKVTTPGGVLPSNKKFRVIPQLLSFHPSSGPVGTVVTITGVSLTQTQGVGFGNKVPASFTVDSDTQVTATVPAGAKSGHVGIQTQGGTAISSGTFNVTP